MKFLVNDLSLDGQFHELASFKGAVANVMEIRQRVRQHGYELFCHRRLAAAKVTCDTVMRQAVGCMPKSEQRALMSWITKQGPHWEDDRLHRGDDYLESGGEVVTDSAIGEAAWCMLRGSRRELVSFDSSSWLMTPIPVRWQRDDGTCEDTSIPNHWTLDSVEEALDRHPSPVASWTDLATRSRERCGRLTFAADAFEPLRGHPFSPGVAARVRVLLNTLDRMKGCFAADCSRTPEGSRLYQDHFTGDKAWFSDSSDSEKTSFTRQLTFKHPEDADATVFCPWHGKVKLPPQFRIHFSWPMTSKDPLYVVYVGPKITRR